MFGVADIVEMVDMNGSRGEGYRWGGWHIFCDTERVGLEIRGYYNPLPTMKLNSFPEIIFKIAACYRRWWWILIETCNMNETKK